MRFTLILLSLLFSHNLLAGTLSFSLNNSPASGTLVVNVYNDANSFGDLREPYQQRQFEITDADTRYSLDQLPPGDYALLIYHDQNRNGQLDRNFVGIPREPIALSNNYVPKGPPSFSRASIRIETGDSVHQELSLAPLMGERGLISVGLGSIVRSSPYADSDGTRVLVIPSLVYFGERLQVAGTVANYNLAGSDRTRLTLVGELRLGAYDEDDSPMLAGMGDRKTTVFGGVALSSRLFWGINSSVAYTHDLLDRVGAGRARAGLSKSFQFGAWRVAPSVSATWLDGSLANYEYGVPLDKATDWRPAYRISDAVNVQTGLSVMYEITPSWLAIVSTHYETLDRKIADSPLIAKRHMTSGFFALTYTF